MDESGRAHPDRCQRNRLASQPLTKPRSRIREVLIRQLEKAFSGKKAFLTGGSSGIGLATARLLVQAGARVAIAGRSAERLHAAQIELRNFARNPDQIVGFPLNVTDRVRVAEVVPRVLETLQGLDFLLNAAGITFTAPVHELSLETFESILKTNFWGVVHTTRAFLPYFQSERRGHISTISSLAGLRQPPGRIRQTPLPRAGPLGSGSATSESDNLTRSRCHRMQSNLVL